MEKYTSIYMRIQILYKVLNLENHAILLQYSDGTQKKKYIIILFSSASYLGAFEIFKNIFDFLLDHSHSVNL